MSHYGCIIELLWNVLVALFLGLARFQIPVPFCLILLAYSILLFIYMSIIWIYFNSTSDNQSFWYLNMLIIVIISYGSIEIANTSFGIFVVNHF